MAAKKKATKKKKKVTESPANKLRKLGAAFARQTAITRSGDVPPDSTLCSVVAFPHAVLEQGGDHAGVGDVPRSLSGLRRFYIRLRDAIAYWEAKPSRRTMNMYPGFCYSQQYYNSEGRYCVRVICYDEYGRPHVISDRCY